MTDLRDQPADPYAAMRAELLTFLELDELLDDWAILDPRNEKEPTDAR